MKALWILLLGALLSLEAGEKLERLILSGPVASVAHPLLRIVESGALKDVAHQVEFRLWNNPDELRALILQKEVDFIALPTNVAAILHQKSQPIELLNVSVWGILQIISRDSSIKRIDDLRGKEVVVPFRADMPDIVLQALLKKAGLEREAVKIRYVASPPDALQLLLTRRADHALLAEPATSMAMRKSGSFPVSLIAPELHRAIDLQSEWGRLFETKPQIPQAGIAAMSALPASIKARFLEEYEKALEWYQQNPQEAGALVGKYIPFFSPEAISDSITHIHLQSVKVKDARAELEAFYQLLHSYEPKLVGGKLPSAEFYQGF